MERRGGRSERVPSSRQPALTPGLCSVRLIVDRLEADYARALVGATHDTRQIVKYDPNVHAEDCSDGDFLLQSSSGPVWSRLIVNFAIALSRCIPSVSYGNFGALAVVVGFIAPRMITYFVVYPFCRLVFGTLYPAYASYKAVRTKNLKEYVKWMMYWIVFALFTCTETFTDVFLSWFPFYYEVKIVIVLWLLSPATKGSSILYRKFVHPALCRREQEIDEYIAKAKDQGYHTVLNLGTKGVNYATTVIMQTAIKGGGGIVQQLRKSYSLSDLTECDAIDDRVRDEADDVMCEPHPIRRSAVRSGYNTRRSASESNSRSAIYFSEVDVDTRAGKARGDEIDFSHVKSSEDISSGYSSADNSGGSLTRTASVGAAAKTRARQPRGAVTSIKRPNAAEDSEVIIEELQDDDSFEFSTLPPLVSVPCPIYMSKTDPPFIYQYVGNQVKIIQVLENPLGANPPIRDQDNIVSTNVHNQKDEAVNDECIIDSINDIKPNKMEIDVSVSENNLDPIELNDKEEYVISDEFDAQLCSEDTKCDVDIPKESNLLVKDDDKNSAENKTIDNDLLSIDNKVNDDANVLLSQNVDRTLDNDSPESDDEASSFGTPDDSPKGKRKSPKGKYGKGKAPPPPMFDEPRDTSDETQNYCNNSVTTSQESLIDYLNTLPLTITKEPSPSKSLQIVNPIAEIKQRHKSKSPRRATKTNRSAIGKLLQIPGKLAFWNKNDKGKSDTKSISSEDNSRRSSTIERNEEDFENSSLETDIASTSADLSTDPIIENIEKCDDQISFKDASDFESVVNQDILDKSDVLQKLIDAKIESHPEYKFIPLNDDNSSNSKSTDV